ncbi:MAG: hypothetical protein E3J65_00690 [Dehalococcoidia bacterium]|nr:MAG: hypothetical protein E3J65_00690 [Dehalococcoidia bacterium]
MVTLFGPNPFEEVWTVIKSWKPRGCKTEKAYEKSLQRELEKKLKNRTIQSQYGAARQRVDICVDGKVPIELKHNLRSTADYQKTKGQLDDYLKKWDGVFLVLCGETDPDILKSLQEYARKRASALTGDRIKIWKV